jgi:hypothetical protein
MRAGDKLIFVDFALTHRHDPSQCWLLEIAGFWTPEKAHGTLGVLVRAIRRKQKTKDEVVTLLRSVPSLSTLHVRPALLEEVIREVEQSQ